MVFLDVLVEYLGNVVLPLEYQAVPLQYLVLASDGLDDVLLDDGFFSVLEDL